MADYRKAVIDPIFKQECKIQPQSISSQTRTLLIRDLSLINDKQQQALTTVLEENQKLKIIYQFRLALQNIWAKSNVSQQMLLKQLQEWCRQAEESSIEALRYFAARLKTYVPST